VNETSHFYQPLSSLQPLLEEEFGVEKGQELFEKRDRSVRRALLQVVLCCIRGWVCGGYDSRLLKVIGLVYRISSLP